MGVFKNYQSLEAGDASGEGKPLRSIPDRVEQYKLADYLHKESTVLDIGCNRGYFGIYLSPHIKEYHGIDEDVQEIVHGKSMTKIIKNIHLFEGDFNQNRFNGHWFDAVFSFAVHCYMAMDMEVYAMKLVSLMKPEGYLFIEGHPKGYEGEPERYQDRLIGKLTQLLYLEDGWVVKDRDNRRFFWVFKKRCVWVKTGGMVSRVCKLESGLVEKSYLNPVRYPEREIEGHLVREHNALMSVLCDCVHVPSVNRRVGNTFYMSDCGDPISEENRPEDWAGKCCAIQETFKLFGYYHNDLKKANVLVKDGRIHIVDFGFWSSTNMHPNSNDLCAIVGNLKVPDEVLPKLRQIGATAASSFATICNTYELAQRCNEEEVPGCFVECGVFAGAQIGVMAVANERFPVIRRVYLYDSFEGIPFAGPEDGEQPGVGAITHNVHRPIEERLKNAGGRFATSDQVKANMALWDIESRSNFQYVEGWFQHTVMGHKEAIALLRLDGDLYESTMICLQYMMPWVRLGGYVIIDDYALGGCFRACKKYFGDQFNPTVVVGGGGPVWFKVEEEHVFPK